ncbi:MAG: hypothetical protein ACYDCL_04100 [Myxococcales bacterium]
MPTRRLAASLGRATLAAALSLPLASGSPARAGDRWPVSTYHAVRPVRISAPSEAGARPVLRFHYHVDPWDGSAYRDRAHAPTPPVTANWEGFALPAPGPLPTGAVGCRKAADCDGSAGHGAVCDMTIKASLNGGDTLVGFCRDACRRDDDCPDGYECQNWLDPEDDRWAGCVPD